MTHATLVLPFQLFDPHPAIRKGRTVILLEDTLVFGGDRNWPLHFHAKKLILHRASMQAYAKRLRRTKHIVQVAEWEAGKHLDDWIAEWAADGLQELHVCELVDDLLERRLQRGCAQAGIELTVSPTPNFVSPKEWLMDQFPEGKKPFMATFYQRQRKRMDILLDADGKPTGGAWSFDPDNRKKLPRGLEPPRLPEVAETKEPKEVVEARKYVHERFPEALGSDAGFIYPITHAAAEAWFETFLVERFRLFGDYEDAISSDYKLVFHGLLTPMLNIGLLDPAKVTARAVEFGLANDIPLNSLEGFVRQIIGWREFMRAMYEGLGVESRNGNFWNFERGMPVGFYDGTTGIDPVDEVIRCVLKHGWCHHIERLMVLGNFMLLCRIHPRAVYRWFMELFVDAYDWVMVPNVYGMSQFADGGLFVTKPYISGSNYIRKMSNWKKGDWCPAWDGLFWTFIEDHRDFFDSNFRLKMMARQLDRMDIEKRSAHRANAETFLAGL